VRKNTINVEKAASLRRLGFKWNAIAKILSDDDSRVPGYHGRSVQIAVLRERKNAQAKR
jgi:hypothetical protein